MSQKNRIIIAVALIAIVAIIAGTAAALLYEGDTYASRLEKGYRYLEQGEVMGYPKSTNVEEL